MTELTDLIHRVNAGAPGSREQLFSAAYTELRRLAHARLRDGGRNTVLDTTALVHETYLKFLGVGAASGGGPARVLRLCLARHALGDH